MSQVPFLRLANGIAIPQLGLGMWQIETQEQCTGAVSAALEAGYRQFDTAQHYNNEFFIGTAVKMSQVPREEIFITTKISDENQGWEDLIPSFNASLRNLQTEFVDLLLLNYPVTKTRRQAWLRMEELYRGGHVKAIGVSNYTIKHLTELLNETALKPLVNQVELHVYLQQPELVAFCKEHGIAVAAASPLAHAKKLDHPTLIEIARRHGRTPAQVMLRWAVQEGAIILPKSVQREHIIENSQVFDFELDHREMTQLISLNQNLHINGDPGETP